MINTQRLVIRPFIDEDWPFIVELLNQPDFLVNIGDKQVRNKADALEYLKNGPYKMQEEYGYSLMAVLLESGELVGMCGLLKRPHFDYPDLGYAISKKHYRQGFAFEACRGVLDYYSQYKHLLAITSLDNLASQQLLIKLGFDKADIIDSPGQGDSQLFVLKR